MPSRLVHLANRGFIVSIRSGGTNAIEEALSPTTLYGFERQMACRISAPDSRPL